MGDGLFDEDAVIRRVSAEGALLIGGGRALLLQLAHPEVARGVADHSGFAADPLRRLRGTLGYVYTVVFGTRAEAHRAAGRVRGIHDQVTGPGYSAGHPALLCWVNATLVDTALAVYTSWVAPLSEREQEEYYQQSVTLAELLGCPAEAQPADLAAFRAYFRGMVGTLEVTDTARRLARDVLYPKVPPGAGQALAPARFVTVGLLPEPVRRQYGFAWSDHRERLFASGTRLSARVLPHLPRVVRHAPKAYYLGVVRRAAAA